MTVLHCVVEQPKYANYKPKDIVGFMRQYATMGNGTKWVGILKGLKHYGYDKSKQLSADTMKQVWAELDKGNRIGGIRMLKGKRGGVTWTSSGHYIMFQRYKKANGKHYFWIKDSGGRHNDSVTHGWYSYEDHMRGMFGPIFIAEREDPPIKNFKPYPNEYELPTTTLKLGSKGEDVIKWQRFLNHVYGDGTKKGKALAEDGKFGNKTDAYTGCFQVY
jgi:hypothetical protein